LKKGSEKQRPLRGETYPVEKKMPDTTEIVTRFSRIGRISAFRRVNAAVHTGERGGVLPFTRLNAAVQTGGRSRSDGCTANGEFHGLQTRDTGITAWILLVSGIGREKVLSKDVYERYNRVTNFQGGVKQHAGVF
jgi:hypothetical protein